MDTLGEWSDGDDEWIFDVDEWDDPEADDIIRNILDNTQTGEGKKRKNESVDDDDDEEQEEQDFYKIENVRKHRSKKFRATATDHTIRFNNVLNDMDLIEKT